MIPEFIVTKDARGTLVRCVYDGETGAARVDSRGLDDAKARAEAQARDKVAKRGPAE